MAQRTIALAALTPGALSPARGAAARDADFDPGVPQGRGVVAVTARPSAPPPAVHTVEGADPSGVHLDQNELDEGEALFLADLLAAHPELDHEAELDHGTDASDAMDFLAAGDLPTEERDALAEHLATCRECQAEMAATAAFYRALSQTHSPEPTPSLVARARLRLDATLDNNAHQSALARMLVQLSFAGGRLRAAPGLASSILLLGLILGGYAGYKAGHSVHHDEQTAMLLEPATQEAPIVGDITSIVSDPDSEMVEVHYNRLVPESLTGSLDDPSIRKLLLIGTLNGAAPGVHHSSLDLLANECRNGHTCNGGPVRNALMDALRTDQDPEVRMVALDGLEPYIAEDIQVRDAVLRVLMSDNDADVRTEAIRVLAPVEIDSTVREALHTVAAQDGNPVIRNASQRILNDMPQVQ